MFETIVPSCDRAAFVLLSALAVGMLSGCGNVLYTYQANSASSKLEEAKSAGAERTATYEYTLAQEHLSKSMSEASEADYGDAYELAELASDYAQKAIDKAKYRTTKEPAQPAAPPAAKKTDDHASLSLSVGETK